MKNDLERHRQRQSKRQTVTQKLSRKNPETAIKRMTEIGKINTRRLSPKMKQSLGRETDIDTGRERLHIKKGSRRHRKKTQKT